MARGGSTRRKHVTEGEKAMARERRRHDSARVLEGTEDPRVVADPVVVAVGAGGHDVPQNAVTSVDPGTSTTDEGRR